MTCVIAFDRRVRAVRRAERVVDVARRRAPRAPSRTPASFFSSSGWKRRFSSSTTHAGRCAHVDACALVADAVGRERDRPAEQLRQAIGDRPQAQLRFDLALRPAEVAGEDDRRALLERVLNGRQRRLDARVVADDAVLERDVEVDADEDALALEIEILIESFGMDHAQV